MTSPIITYLHDTLGVADVEAETALIDEGYLDSIQALELATFIASEYSIDLTQDDMRVENFSSIDAIERFIAAKRQSG